MPYPSSATMVTPLASVMPPTRSASWVSGTPLYFVGGVMVPVLLLMPAYPS